MHFMERNTNKALYLVISSPLEALKKNHCILCRVLDYQPNGHMIMS